MYAGSDSTDAQNCTQWALNPSYQKMSNEEVDWAALAQQWIIMKEAGPPVPEQATNPPPSTATKLKKEAPNEGGEAPMEVENDAEDPPLGWNDGGGSGDSWHWNQQQWNWNNSWSAPPGVPPPNAPKPPLLPTPPAYNQYGSSDNCNDNGNYGYNSASSSEFPGNYWSSASSSKVIKPHNKRYSKVNVPTTVPTSKPINLDAAKRKQLPAWIREGLEKMERDKLKQLDKARENQEKAEYQAKLKINEKNAMEILKDTVKEQQQKSKFESDGEESDEDNNGRPLTPEDPPLTQEDLMLKVRRTMTEILLKVTNREIYSICKEELQRHLKKMKASDQRVSAPSGANLSAKLGLGVYGGSESSSDSSDESGKDQNSSDTELKDTIKRRKLEFVKTEREIEEKLADAEKHEGGESKAASPNQSDIDSQVDAKVLDSKKNSDERTPPLKNNSRRKSRKSVSSTSSSSESDNSDNRSKSNRGRRHSTSTVSSDSDDKYNKRNSGSRTPEQRRNKYSSYSESSDKRRKYSESKIETSQTRRSRSRSSGRRRHSRSSSRRRNDRSLSRSRYRRSRSRSRSRSHYNRRSSPDRSRRSVSRRSRRSTSYSRRRQVSSTRRSRSRSSKTRKHRRSRSYSSGRGKRSHRH